MPKEIAKFIPSRFGQMFIVEHNPDNPGPTLWIISLNSGLQCRTGPRRLNLHFARHLAELGIGVLRADLPGVGDSDGPQPATHFDMHDPKDVQTLVDYVRQNLDCSRVILHGLCAGGRVAIKAASQCDYIDGVLAWSVPILTPGLGATKPLEEPEDRVTRAVAKYRWERVLLVFRERKFLKIRFWQNILKSPHLIPVLKSTFWSVWLLLRNPANYNYKGLFIDAIRQYVRSGRRILFLYGERDTIAFKEFEDLALEIPAEDYILIPDGTHTFSSISQKDDAYTATYTWLKSVYS